MTTKAIRGFGTQELRGGAPSLRRTSRQSCVALDWSMKGRLRDSVLPRSVPHFLLPPRGVLIGE